MTKALRLSEKWFHRGLWLVAIVFAGFLIGLGRTVVGDLPKVEKPLRVEDFMDRASSARVEAQIAQAQLTMRDAQAALEQASLKRRIAEADTQAARDSLNSWLATRHVTQLAQQDPEVVSRTENLDRLRQAERDAQGKAQQQTQVLLDARQQLERSQRELGQMQADALQKLNAEARRVELRVFLYRLAVTLPPLAIAGWLLKTQRRSTWWPFVWGFALFAAFAFFVELVPYLPSYGGYVRYIVGIIVTVLVGRQAILALNRYLERQRAAEQLPDAQRRGELGYDTALARLAKGVCPGCERPVDLKNAQIDFCPHCGIGVYDRCGQCGTRKSAFARFCPTCGTPAGAAGPGFTRLVTGPA